jgi:hypothetical protein
MGKIFMNRGRYVSVTDLRTDKTTFRSIVVGLDGGLRMSRRRHKTAAAAEGYGLALTMRLGRMRRRGDKEAQ